MKSDAMIWVQRIVAAVFALGLVSLVGAIVTQVGQAEGLPPLPIFLGLLGIVTLILLAGACLALISLAISARGGADALRRMAGQPQAVAAATALAAPPRAAAVFGQPPLRDVAAGPQMPTQVLPQSDPALAPGRAAPSARRTLVAER